MGNYNSGRYNTGEVNMDVNSRNKSNYSDDFVFEDSVDINNPYPSKKGGKRTSKKGKKGSKAKLAIIITSIVLVVLIGGVCVFTFTGGFDKLTDKTFKFDKNIYVEGICLEEMTYEQAKQALLDKEKTMSLDINLNVKVNDKSVALTTQDFSYKFNTIEVLDEAKAYCESDSKSKEKKEFNITAAVEADSVTNAVSKVCKETEHKEQNAKVTAFDYSAENMFTYQNEEIGIDVDDALLKDDITKMFDGKKYSGEIVAKYSEIKPKITKSFLKENITVLGEYETFSTNNANGNSNMKTALAACNNSVIEPGATWSFNECTGDSNLESNGYLPAGVISDGRLETGIGGGLCQASSTIYNAALLADMEVVERSNHRWPSSYVPVGLDATIDYPNLDLKLKNKGETQMFMGCSMSGAKLFVQIFGVKSGDYDEIKINHSSDGDEATASRSYYKDGQLIKTEELPSSSYKSNSNTPSPSSKPSSSSKKPESSSKTESKKPESKPVSSKAPDPEPDPEPTPVESEPESTPEEPETPDDGGTEI